jgi:DNA-binding winged helix-turn-helix (wHTH) protein
MSQVRTPAAGFHFDDFFIDAANRQLWREGELVPLNSKYFDVLLLLVSECGQLVEKQRIFEEIWKSVFVTDAALTQCIKDIRKQLGDDAANPRYIRTVPKHGYIFIGNAVETDAESKSNGSLSPQTPAPTPPEITAQVIRLVASRPYKFLDYYTEQDANLFFGREVEIETIGSQILARRSFILHGRSGVGKSSILRAGVLPRLKEQGHLVFVIRSFTDPLHQMISALAEDLGVDSSFEKASSWYECLEQAAKLKELLEQATLEAPRRSVIFFLDQFEEFFSLLNEESHQYFIDALSKLAASESLPMKLVFALREDFLAEMSQFKTAIPEIFHHEYHLKRLSREQAARAITEPANAVGCRYEPLLVERLLNDLSDKKGVDPPQLQIVCDCLFDSKDVTGNLTVATYKDLGTASQILAGYLERVLRRFNAAELQIAKEILSALIAEDGRRLVLRAVVVEARVGAGTTPARIVTGDEEALRKSPSGQDLALPQPASENRSAPSAVNNLMEELVAARVVRRRNQDGEAWLELAHDFLTPEVSRWLTHDDRQLKQARSVLERATENFNAHELLLDVDALDVLLPFGEKLGLTGEEADLLAMSLMNRGRSVPEWLAKNATSLPALIEEAARQSDANIRLCAVEACAFRRDENTKGLLRHLSLWDEELAVRKAASIALADWFQTAVASVLSADAEQTADLPQQEMKRAGTIRRAISLAMIRDYDKRLVWLQSLSIPVSVLVVGGLIWVRLLRGGEALLKQGTGGTLGAAASGLVGGFMLGLALAIARHLAAIEAASLLFVLISLGAFIGGIGGFGVSFGMVAASHITYRHSRWWSVIGGAAGGAAVGGITNILGVDIIRSIFGRNPSGITGAMEGAVIGAGLSLGAVLVSQLFKDARPFQRVLGAALGAMCAGIVLTVIGGNLFSGSLEVVARSFADSQIRMEPLAPYFGAASFNHTRQIIFGAIEGLMFGAGLMSGIEILSRPRK